MASAEMSPDILSEDLTAYRHAREAVDLFDDGENIFEDPVQRELRLGIRVMVHMYETGQLHTQPDQIAQPEVPPEDDDFFDPTNGEWLTSRELAEYTHFSLATIRRWSDQGRLKHVRTPGNQRRFRPDAVHNMIRSEAAQRRAANQ